jgi:hypothetical protein
MFARASFWFCEICPSSSRTLADRSGAVRGAFCSSLVAVIFQLSTGLSKVTEEKLESVWLSLAFTALKYWSTTPFSSPPQATPRTATARTARAAP